MALASIGGVDRWWVSERDLDAASATAEKPCAYLENVSPYFARATTLGPGWLIATGIFVDACRHARLSNDRDLWIGLTEGRTFRMDRWSRAWPAMARQSGGYARC